MNNMKSDELSLVCFHRALWIGKHFSLHLRVLLTGLHWRIGNKYVNEPEKILTGFYLEFLESLTIKEALDFVLRLTTNFCFDLHSLH